MSLDISHEIIAILKDFDLKFFKIVSILNYLKLNTPSQCFLKFKTIFIIKNNLLKILS